MANLLQCTVCGFLENGYVKMMPCPGRKEHSFKPLSTSTIASAFGSAGKGRHKKRYATEAERIEARRRTFRRSNRKRQGLPVED